ncbi:MAG: 5-formyltetrahydrofolate cyclo-ligase, partial [Gammaproteobacteria bacterium]
MQSNISSKKEIRKLIKQKIISLPLTTKNLATDLIFNKITTLLSNQEFSKMKYFGSYWPLNHEVNTIHLISYLLNNNKFCYLPAINYQENTLNFIKYTSKTKLITNKFRILEPEYYSEQEQINPENLEIIFIPSIAFNQQGNRIGSGLGYYDRTLNNMPKSKLAKIKLIGIGFAQQQLDNYTFIKFNQDPW